MANYLNSITQYNIAIGTSAAAGTTALSPTVGANAFIVFNGITGNGTNANASLSRAYVSLLGGTAIKAVRNRGTSADALQVYCTVIDPTANLVSTAQAGVINITNAGTGTAVINSINTNNSSVFYLGNNCNNAGEAPTAADWRVGLNDGTSVIAVAGSAASSAVIGYNVVTWAAEALQSNTQQFSIAFGNANTTNTQAITTVTNSNAFIAYGGLNSGNGTNAGTSAIGHSYSYLNLANGTTVNSIRIGTGTQQYVPAYTVVEFVPGVLKSLQRGQITLGSGVTTNTAVINSVTSTNAFVNFPWFNINPSGQTWFENLHPSILLNDGTTVFAQRQSAGSASTISILEYEVIEFAPNVIGTITETATESDSYAVNKTAIPTLSETQTETDSYTVTQTISPPSPPSPPSSPPSQTGSGNDPTDISRKKWLEWKEKKKTKSRAELLLEKNKRTYSPPIPKIDLKLTTSTTSTTDWSSSEPEINLGDIAQKAALRSISQLSNVKTSILPKIDVNILLELQEQDDEEAFVVLM